MPGAYPNCSLVQLGNVLYGTTPDNSSWPYNGCIFSINDNGSSMKDVYDFVTTTGYQPSGSLTLSGGTLYGMAASGGADSAGCIFSFNINGKGYKDLFDFDRKNGAEPYSNGLIISGGVLYGVTQSGGANNAGCIFSVDTNGNNYKDIYNYSWSSGGGPSGSLLLVGDKFYGMTRGGGAHDSGSIFSIDTNGLGYKDIFDFTTTYGATPNGSLILLGSSLFGTTEGGGVNGYGCIFSIDTNGSAYKKLHDFNQFDGGGPVSSLTLTGDTLYGTSSWGGTHNGGVIFSIDTGGINYTDLYNFNIADGADPYGPLIIWNGMLYGTASGGGEYGYGVVFSFKYLTSSLVKDSITTIKNEPCVGDSIGSVSIIGINGIPPYTYRWSPGYNTSNHISGLKAGTYTISISDANGNNTIDSVTITQPPPLKVISSSTLSSCNISNGSASVIASGGTLPFSYLWEPSANTNSVLGGVSAGYYTCIVTDSKSCNDKDTVTVSVKDSGTMGVSITYVSPKCFGASNGVAKATIINGVPPYKYVWSPYGGYSDTVTNLKAGTYTVTVIDSNNCKADTFVTIAQPTPLNIITIISYGDSSCNNSAWLNVHGGTTPYSYLWSNGTTTDPIANVCTGLFCCTVTDANGCIDTSCFTFVGIASLSNENKDIKAYPNPGSGKFYFELGNRGEYLKIEVYDILGKRIYQSDINSTFSEVDLSTQLNGIYFYRITTQEGQLLSTGKLIVQ